MQGYGSTGAYGAYGSGGFGHQLASDAMGGFGAKRLGGMGRRMNLVSMAFSHFIPWIVFCLDMGMLSFHMHYHTPDLCKTLLIIQGVVFGLFVLLAFAIAVYQRFYGAAGSRQDPSWLCFIAVTSLSAMACATVVGNRNFRVNTQPYFDIIALNQYQGVDVARMRGQELMDAGRVNFVEGTHVDTSRAMAFVNFNTYCAAPIVITSGSVEGTPALAAYDFWAVGKDCCQTLPGGGVDFRCGTFESREARGGIRLLANEDRAFYRLAVQQAESTYALRAVHPLFFHWVEKPDEITESYMTEAHKTMLASIFAFFGFQLVLVYAASTCFMQCFGS